MKLFPKRPLASNERRLVPIDLSNPASHEKEQPETNGVPRLWDRQHNGHPYRLF
jgi:hypothetical protein